uniref:Uncharacterized protein n=1 Tax=Gadus morhua TaxID=8049 RepID=A0A8C5CV96_GADMO
LLCICYLAERLVMANHTHTWWYNSAPLTSPSDDTPGFPGTRIHLKHVTQFIMQIQGDNAVQHRRTQNWICPITLSVYGVRGMNT